MANICYAANMIVDDAKIISVKSAAATLDDGNLVVATSLSTDSGDGEDLYVATQPTAITDGDLAIIIADEVYEDALGNRIPVKDPSKITYNAGTVLKAIRPYRDLKFKATNSIVDAGTVGNIAVGKYLIPKATSYSMDVADDLITNPKYAFIIEKIIGIEKGIGNVSGMLLRTVVAE